MKRMLINATQQEELRVALVDGQQLYDLDIETLYSAQKKSNIYKGKITRIEPSLEAVFVDYGGQRHGFLPFKEIAKEYLTGSTSIDEQSSLKDMINVGQEVLVQIDKEERGHKGAALTTYISLAGRFLVLMPNNPRAGGVSRRIQGDERKELRDTLDQLDAPADMGVIVRTAGVGRAQEELQWDLDFLLQLWQAIDEEYQKATPQRLIYQESNIIVRALRDYLRPDIGQILIDDERVYQQAADFMNLVMPNNTNKLKLYNDNIPLFTRYQIEGQIESAYQRNVNLPSGGELVIDYTEALVSIDINSSKSTKGEDIEETAYQTNLEAVDEIARQMRLRDLGGLIVIDFIDMVASRHRKDIEYRLIEATKIDRARVQIGRISRFGLLELSRQRLRPSIDEASHRVCPRCKGQGSIRGIQSMALSLLRLIEEEAMKERTRRIMGELPVNVATFLLNEKRTVIRQIELRNKVEVILMANPNLHTPDYFIERLRDDEIDEDMTITPSYRLPVRRESVDEHEEVTQNLSEPEQAAVRGIMPREPIPEQSKGLTSFIAKVVSLFKDKGDDKKAHKNAKHHDKIKNTDDEPQSRQRSNKQDRRKSNQDSNKQANNKRSQRNRRQDNDVAGIDAKDKEQDKKRNQSKTRDYREQKHKEVLEEAGQKPERSNKKRQPKDDVNPTIEALQNPPRELNGREVRKGRPRDVHAVRGQGKAAMNEQAASLVQEKGDTVNLATRPADAEKKISAKVAKTPKAPQSVDVGQAPAVDSTDNPKTTAAQAPGLVSLLVDGQQEEAINHGTQELAASAPDPDSKMGEVQLSEDKSGQDTMNDKSSVQLSELPESVEAKVATVNVDDTVVASKKTAEPKQAPAKLDVQTVESVEPEVDTVNFKVEAQVSKIKAKKIQRQKTEKQSAERINPFQKLPALGQSIWFDNIHRNMLKEGKLTKMIAEDDLRGVTSNPAIFQKAFIGDAYDAGLKQWMEQHDGGVREAFFALAIEDIQQACDQMMPVYEKTNGTDGMVSLEVSPDIANDSEKTIVEARELYKRVNRDNVMIKVPATKAGLEAIRTLIADGINVNVTLLFSVERYGQVLEAYIDGLKARVEAGKSIDMIRSVASFFVSRVDTKVDAALTDEFAHLRGRTAIANAQMAYAYYLERISYDDWINLMRRGAAVQRLLWASTGTKNPAYSDVRYVDLLIGADTVNTVPPATYAAFKDHGKASSTLLRDIEKASEVIQAVKDAGVDMDTITEALEVEGVALFEQAFTDLLTTLEAKMNAMRPAEKEPVQLSDSQEGEDD